MIPEQTTPKELVALLASDASLQLKARACQQLAIGGGPDAVAALAGLLGDERLADFARCALELIPAPAAGDALRNALPKLRGALLAGAVDSLGVLRDPAAVPALLALLKDPALASASGALAALGKIATEQAATGIREILKSGPPALQLAAAHAALAAANGLLREEKPEAATSLLDALLASDPPPHLRQAAAKLRETTTRVRLFDGTTFAGWEGDLTWFRIADGAVIAGSLLREIPHNEFLATRGEYDDFELRLKVRLAAGKGNGGIQFRSRRVPGSREMAGYQADVAANYWGALYDESRRRKFLGPAPDPALIAGILKPDAWNDYRIRCEGPHIRLWLNGHLTTDFTESDPSIARSGHIGLQIHAGPPTEAWYKEIELETLHRPE